MLRQFQMNECRFKLRTRQPIIDAIDDATQIQKSRYARGLAEEPLQTPMKQRCACKIRPAFAGPQQKDRGPVGNRIDLAGKYRSRLTHISDSHTPDFRGRAASRA